MPLRDLDLLRGKPKKCNTRRRIERLFSRDHASIYPSTLETRISDYVPTKSSVCFGQPPAARRYDQNLKSDITMHFLAGISMLVGYNLSLTANNEFEVQINDSTSAVEPHAPFLFATAPMHTTGSARRCCSGGRMQAGECANARHRMLDLGRQSRGSTRKTASVLASRCVFNTRRGRSRQGAAWHSDRIVWQSVVDDHRGRELEICPRRSHCKGWTASGRRRRKILGAVYGSGLHTRNDGTRTHTLREAWYAVGGETCLETSDGRMQISRAGGSPVIVPMGLSMHLTAIASERRRSIVIILHQSSQPPTTMVHDWSPKGLCKVATDLKR